MVAALIAPAGAGASDVYVANFTAPSAIRAFSYNAVGSLSTINCGNDCSTGMNPNGIAVSPDGQFLYAANGQSNSVSPFAIHADGSLTKITCSGSSCATGTGPFGVAVSPDGKFVYTPNFSSQSVSAFAIHGDGELTSITCSGCTTGMFPEGIAVSPGGRFLYVTNEGGGSVSAFAIQADGSLVPISCSSCTTGTNPEAVAASPDGRFVYVANFTSGTITPFAVNPDGSLSPIACGSGCVTGTSPMGLAISPDGRFLYAADDGSAKVSPYTINSDGTLSPIPCPSLNCTTGLHPRGIAVSPNSQFLYASNGVSNTVSPFAIDGDGSLSPINCTVGTCSTGKNPGFQALAISPDQAPTASFSATAGFADTPTRFDASASTAARGQSVARYDWGFGDGHTADDAGPTPAHSYAAPGGYAVTVTVTDDAGCSTAQTYTGQTASCNGGPTARVTHPLTIKTAPPPTPPNTKIKSAKVSHRKHRATFRFKAVGSATGFQCELRRKHAHRKPRFRNCRSPKTYRHLRHGRYTFEVRAVGAAGPDPSPAKRKFRETR